VEQMNDDDILLRELEVYRSKNTNSAENVNLEGNHYNKLFHSQTGVVIANGDKNKEGVIEKMNPQFEEIFEYGTNELKGMNLTTLMPKCFEKDHRNFMKRYLNIGCKRVIDKNFKTYGKDKDNSLIPITISIKLFPVLTDFVYYCGLIMKEEIDDILLIDEKFLIQGMANKLLDFFK